MVELEVWIRWLQNCERSGNWLSAANASELARVLQKAHGKIQELRIEMEILKAKENASNGRKDGV